MKVKLRRELSDKTNIKITTLMKITSRYFNTGLLLAALALLPFAPSAIAGDEVPYKGTETGVILRESFQFPFEAKSVVATGEATHLGEYTLIGNFVVDVRFGSAAGTFTIQAANGDMLFLTMEGHVVLTDFTKTILNFTITGGTGRFEDATGNFTAHNQLAFFAGTPVNPYVGEIKGVISTPGANKK
jgi:hypothetical protein